jgi:predicted HAD superfamily Cof-like phosphohydrolase|tara:strand:+ start:29905 stop:30315 length:411 start_codon:yes stop_codon:yes gene_type:complete
MPDMINDIYMMHSKFGVKQWFEANKHDKELMANYLAFRMSMVKEEYDETMEAIEAKDAEEVVDGLIDIIVFALGTLDIFNVDAGDAWNRIYRANMQKEPGVKSGRPNPYGLPDMLKPEGWVNPNHKGNHGDIPNAL